MVKNAQKSPKNSWNDISKSRTKIIEKEEEWWYNVKITVKMISIWKRVLERQEFWGSVAVTYLESTQKITEDWLKGNKICCILHYVELRFLIFPSINKLYTRY